MQDIQQEINKIWNGWNVVAVLGEGAFGKVYKVVKEEFGHNYEAALKIIKIPANQAEMDSILNDGMDEKSITEYFRGIMEDIVNEVSLMSKLKGNTHIVSYEDHVVVPNKEKIGWTIYIRMELLIPLFMFYKKNSPSRKDVIQLGIDICKALEVCEKYKVIHRDIKPENIFVSELGKYKLGDFGIAKQMEKSIATLSRKGTQTYMAPEIYLGNNYNQSVDIYSLGIVLYRFLNGNRVPFLPAFPEQITPNDKQRANLKRIKGCQIPSPGNADKELARVILKACAYRPEERYQNAEELKIALEKALDKEKKEKESIVNWDTDDFSNTIIINGDKTELLRKRDLYRKWIAMMPRKMIGATLLIILAIMVCAGGSKLYKSMQPGKKETVKDSAIVTTEVTTEKEKKKKETVKKDSDDSSKAISKEKKKTSYNNSSSDSNEYQNDFEKDSDEEVETEVTTEMPITEAPTTEAPATEAPTTEAPTTQAPNVSEEFIH